MAAGPARHSSFRPFAMQHGDASSYLGSAESGSEFLFLDPSRKRSRHYMPLGFLVRYRKPPSEKKPEMPDVLRHPLKRYLSDKERIEQMPEDYYCCSFCYDRPNTSWLCWGTGFKSLYNVYSPSSNKHFWRLIMAMNADNMETVWRKLLKMNFIGKMDTLFCCILECQSFNIHITNNYASMISRLNRMWSVTGQLFLKMCLDRFTVVYNAKLIDLCKPVVEFLAYLVNHNVVHCLVAIDLLNFFAARPSTRDSMQMVFIIFKTCGHKINLVCPRETKQVVGAFRTTLRKKRYRNKEARTLLKNVVDYSKVGFKFKDAPQLNTEELSIGSQHSPHLIRLNEDNYQQNKCSDHFDRIHISQDEAILKTYKKLSNKILKSEKKKDRERFNCASTEGDNELSEGEPEAEANDPSIKTILAVKLINGILVDSKITCYKQKAHYINAIKIVPRAELCHHFLNGCCKRNMYSERGSRIIAQLLCDLDASNAESLEIVLVDNYENAKDLHGEQFTFVVEFFAFLLVEKSISWNVFSKINLSNVLSVSSVHFIKLLVHEMIADMGSHQMLSYMTQPQIIPAFKGIFLTENEKVSNFAVDTFSPDQLYLLAQAFKKHLSPAAPPLAPKEASVANYDGLKLLAAFLCYVLLVFLFLFFFSSEKDELLVRTMQSVINDKLKK